ncbi:MAG: hypothetical protein GY813_03835 [Halieaceae bacterium]|nr:hypothetical protein [Halieaceae bacterium]
METLNEIASLLGGEPESDAAVETQTPESEHQPDQEIDSSASEPEQDENAPDEQEEAPQETEEPLTTLKALAEKLEMQPKDLYAVELGDGLTIGQLKDRMKDLTEADTLRDKAEAHKIQTENELMSKRRELALVQQNLGREPTPAEQVQAEQQWEAYVSHETSQTMKAIPDWAEPSVMEAERDGIVELLQGYGFSQSEMAATIDHRQVKLLRDYSKLLKRISGAGTEVKTKAPKPGRKQRKRAQTSSDGIMADVKSGKLSAQDGIAQLLS